MDARVATLYRVNGVCDMNKFLILAVLLKCCTAFPIDWALSVSYRLPKPAWVEVR